MCELVAMEELVAETLFEELDGVGEAIEKVPEAVYPQLASVISVGQITR